MPSPDGRPQQPPLDPDFLTNLGRISDSSFVEAFKTATLALPPEEKRKLQQDITNGGGTTMQRLLDETARAVEVEKKA